MGLRVSHEAQLWRDELYSLDVERRALFERQNDLRKALEQVGQEIDANDKAADQVFEQMQALGVEP
jgi:hypothetical protein